MTLTALAATLLPSAAAHLAVKHGVSVDRIAQALESGNVRIAEQLADLMTAAAVAAGVVITR